MHCCYIKNIPFSEANYFPRSLSFFLIGENIEHVPRAVRQRDAVDTYRISKCLVFSLFKPLTYNLLIGFVVFIALVRDV